MTVVPSYDPTLLAPDPKYKYLADAPEPINPRPDPLPASGTVSPTTTNVPSVAFHQFEKFVPAMLAESAARVRLVEVVGMI